MLREKEGVVGVEIALCIFEKFGGGFLALSTQLICDLLRTALFLKEFTLDFQSSPLCLGRSLWIREAYAIMYLFGFIGREK